MKKQSNESSNNFPYANETKKIRQEFIKMIQSMSDDEFESFVILFLDYLGYLYSFDDDEDEIFENEDLPF